MIFQLLFTFILAIFGPGISNDTDGNITGTNTDIGISKSLKPKLKDRTTQAL